VIILGIDPGLAHTGWGIVETRGSLCRARAYGCVTTHSGEPIDQRLGKIFDEVSRAIEAYHPTQLAIEQLFFGENARSAVATAQARGVAIVACAQAGLEVGEYTPMQIKQAVVGTGAADKRQVMFMVRSILNLDHEPRPDHAADALAVAICHAHLCRTKALARDASPDEVSAAEVAQLELSRLQSREVTAAARAANARRHAHGAERNDIA
jgi:crossover junction endodeoxyribonuclease RuvC